MTRKAAIVLGTLVVLVVGGIAAFVLLDSPPSVSADSFRRLRPCMSSESVQSIFGRASDPSSTPVIQSWKEGGIEIRVYFDQQDQVVEGVLLTQGDVETLHNDWSLLGTIRSMLHW